jgi:hypothetical protein
MSSVPRLSVSISSVVIVHSLVLPRIIMQIDAESRSSSHCPFHLLNSMHSNSSQNSLKLEINHWRIICR